VERELSAAQAAEANNGPPTGAMRRLEGDVRKFKKKVTGDEEKDTEKLRSEAAGLISRAKTLKAQASGDANPNTNATPAITPTPAQRGTPEVTEAPPTKMGEKGNSSNDAGGLLDYIPNFRTILLVIFSLATSMALVFAGWFVFKLHRRVGDLEGLHGKVVQRLRNM